MNFVERLDVQAVIGDAGAGRLGQEHERRPARHDPKAVQLARMIVRRPWSKHSGKTRFDADAAAVVVRERPLRASLKRRASPRVPIAMS